MCALYLCPEHHQRPIQTYCSLFTDVLSSTNYGILLKFVLCFADNQFLGQIH